MAQKFNPLSGQFDTVLDKASEIKYDNSTSGLTANTVQDAVDELENQIATLPDPITYKGTWDASTNIPTLSNSDTGVTGFLYQVNVAGTVDFGAGSISFDIGDKVVNDGSAWQKWDHTDAVNSVNGQTGNVVLDTDDILEGSTNLYFTDERAQDAAGAMATSSTKVSLTYDDVSNTLTPDIVTGSLVDADISLTAAIDATKIANGSVSNTEFQYLDGVTSSIQTQLTGKANTDLSNIAPTASVSFNTQKITNVVDPTNPQDVATKNYVDTATSGANTTLSNLTSPTAINQDLVFNKTAPKVTTTAGATAQPIIVQPGNINSGTGVAAQIIGGTSTTGTGGNAEIIGGAGVASAQAGGNASLTSGAGNSATSGTATVTTAASSITGAASLRTGNASAGNSGAITIQTGTSTGGARGSITMSGNGLIVNTGTTSFSGSQLSTVGVPAAYDDAATKNYVDAQTTRQYIPNANFENNSTTGWSTFGVTMSGTTPTSAPGAPDGTLNVFSINTSTPLSGLRSLEVGSSGPMSPGQGIITSAMTIDPADQAKVLTFSFSYKNTVGSLLNFSGTSSNTFAIWIYDVTNAAWVQPAGVYSMTQGEGVGIATGTFQTAANGSQYRLAILYVNSTSFGGTIICDRFFLGPQTAPIGAVATDEQAYTPTITGFGTVTNNSAVWSRIGDKLYVRGSFTSGTPAAAPGRIGLPNVNIDTNKLGTSQKATLGSFTRATPSTSVMPATSLGPWILTNDNTVTSSVATSTNVGTGANHYQLTNGNTITSSGDDISYEFTVPIAGWSSNVVMSNSTDTRVIDFAGQSNATQAMTANVTNTNIQLSFKDSAAGWNGSVYTVPVAGDYNVTFNARLSSGTANGVVYINGSAYIGLSALTTTINGANALIPNLKAGDTISVRLDASVTLTSGTVLNIFRLSGPSIIAATESVNCRYTNSSAQSISTATVTTITNWTKQSDTHNAFNATTGLYTVPVSGTYFITASATLSSLTNASSQVTLGIQVGGSNISNFNYTSNAMPFASITLNGTATATLIAGQVISIIVFQNQGASRTLSSTGSENTLSIARIGN